MGIFGTLFLWSTFFSVLKISSAIDTMEVSESIRDCETIVSAGGLFELGFFTPGDSKNRYVGIWYKKISVMTVVWVANREIPLPDLSGVLKVNNQGILTLLNGNKTIIWSSNSTSTGPVGNPIARLLDSGNLVLRERHDTNPENYLWQSFDYPCDTFLPGMKIGMNMVTGIERHMTSWKSSNDPSRGEFTLELDTHGFPQLVVRNGSDQLFCSGPWNGIRFSGTPLLRQNPIYKYNLVLNQEEVYYTYEQINSRVITRLLINPSGIVQRFVWTDQTQGWELYLNFFLDICDNYAYCGAHGICKSKNSPECECLIGFVPVSQRESDVVDWSHGCVRRTQFDCQKGDGFLMYSSIKLPDTHNAWFDRSMTLEQCKMVCLKNCSCMAYARLNISEGGSGCLHWFGDLIDIRVNPENGQDLYIRMASSEIAKVGSSSTKRVRYIATSVILTGIFLLGLSLTLYMWRKKKQQLKRKGKMEQSPEGSDTTESQNEDLELPLFDYATIANATDNFSSSNKLGEGGFGPVYKGVLNDGQEIAVKKLSKSSRQGTQEFKNEALCIAKLQHRNLVKLLGCCVQVEKMLIYEYMPNKSLDFIFDQTRSMVLDWPKRINIINGIARGLLYLHQDSRLRIIHRDLKASNILLDNEMNPKISDFGVARSFGGNETEANTTTVVGTYGYMSPEYAIDGLFSVKSDVFSFGVLVLEIVSGKKNRGFYHKEHYLNLLGHAWKFFNEGRSIELVDMSMQNSCHLSEVLRSIHVGLLCVQQSPEDRPSMSTVVLMLTSENELPIPKQPGFFSERNILGVDSSAYDSATANEITVTLLAPR